MAFKNFSQYLEDKINKPLAGKTKTEKVADYSGSAPVAPPKEIAPKTGDKEIKPGGAKQLGGAAPYKTQTRSAKTGIAGADKGFVYAKSNIPPTEFDTEIPQGKSYGGVPGGKPVSSAFMSKGDPGDPNQTTGMTQKTSSQLIGLNSENFINKTKNLSLAEFTKKIHKDVQRGMNDCGCKAPNASIRETVEACKCNKKYVETLVREMKRNGLLKNFITEAANFDEDRKSVV